MFVNKHTGMWRECPLDNNWSTTNNAISIGLLQNSIWCGFARLEAKKRQLERLMPKTSSVKTEDDLLFHFDL